MQNAKNKECRDYVFERPREGGDPATLSASSPLPLFRGEGPRPPGEGVHGVGLRRGGGKKKKDSREGILFLLMNT